MPFRNIQNESKIACLYTSYTRIYCLSDITYSLTTNLNYCYGDTIRNTRLERMYYDFF